MTHLPNAHPLLANTRRSRWFWLGASLLVAIAYSSLVLQRAFRAEYVVQDDARQHLFWMQRFFDPELFANDLIADYFQSVAPWGFTTFYRLFAALGMDPLLLSKLLPPVLALAATGFGFGVAMQFLPVPIGGFFVAILLNLVFWSHDDLASATPRAFMIPLFLAFLYTLLRRHWGCWLAIALMGLFYPQYALVCGGVLAFSLVQWQKGRLGLTHHRADWVFLGIGLGIAVSVLLPYLLADNPYGPALTAADVLDDPEFLGDGRGRFFLDDVTMFWLSGHRSGLFPTFKPPLMGLGVFLPLLLWKLPTPLVRQVKHLGLLLRIVAAALVLFFAAHALLFRLHLPSRYTGYTLRFVLCFAAAIALTLLLDTGLRWLPRAQVRWLPAMVLLGGIGAIAASVWFYPRYITPFPADEFRVGQAPAVYEFFAQQPKDIVIASLEDEADFIPVFSGRSILFGREYAIPYHKAYGQQMRQRATDLIRAQYTRDPALLRATIDRYSIDFWLISRTTFRPGTLQALKFRQYPEALAEAQTNLQTAKPILARRANRCQVLQAEAWTVLDAVCLRGR
ncbi:hypothetical protein [Thermoleptolyngbya sp. C42_A2020_037]|uniref:hypothetical protein n=1 Tax=Thermoleptolyngbya sp. C42_A2020_037 TaxID=2747799 RepID=UPI0019FC83EE|nr:hypothetical protein [Thermoleptolyngbya sp. C42_A2020_037]MBF2083527.1 hypothetical protein [Thermoleptolyngbya sp. C42_A2020_037]